MTKQWFFIKLWDTDPHFDGGGIRFKEREENVKLEIFHTFTLLLRQARHAAKTEEVHGEKR